MTTTDKGRAIGCCWKCQVQVYYDCKDPSCECHIGKIPAVNYLQVGKQNECGHCNPKEYGEGLRQAQASIPNFICECTCHKEKADVAYSGPPMFKGIPNSDGRGWEPKFYDLTKTMDGLYRPQLKLLIESLLQQERAKGYNTEGAAYDFAYKRGKKEVLHAVEEWAGGDSLKYAPVWVKAYLIKFLSTMK